VVPTDPADVLGRAGSGTSHLGRHRLVFTRADGQAIDPKDDQTWKALLGDAGVRDARLHDARHTAATIMLTMGVPARAVMHILGHSQITLTLGTYSPVEPELANEAAHRIGRALWD
jgi:integrase